MQTTVGLKSVSADPMVAPDSAGGYTHPYCDYLLGLGSDTEISAGETLLSYACRHLSQNYVTGGNGGPSQNKQWPGYDETRGLLDEALRPGELRYPDHLWGYPVDCTHFVSNIFADYGQMILHDHFKGSAIIKGYHGNVAGFNKAMRESTPDYDLRWTGQVLTQSQWKQAAANGSIQPGDVIIYAWQDKSGGKAEDRAGAHVALFMGIPPGYTGARIIAAAGYGVGIQESGPVVYDGHTGLDTNDPDYDKALGYPMRVVAIWHSHMSTEKLLTPPALGPGPGLACPPGTASPGYDFLGNNCPDVLSEEVSKQGKKQLWVRPINGQKATGHMLMDLSRATDWSNVSKFVEAGNLDSDAAGT
ncbi:MAG: hypothetical protein ACXWNR_02050, partial [Candidatus Limnocylindrales bacterium]